MAVTLLVLVDNNATSDALAKEHGLSMLMEANGQRVLFDAAASGQAVRQNAEAMGVDLASVEAAILSHGHYDHTGGLETLAEHRPGLNIYAHPGTFSRRWSDHTGQPLRDISCPHTLRKLRDRGAVFHAIEHPEKLTDWLVLSGPIGGPGPRRQNFVVRKADEIVVDGFEDELFCLLRGENGWVVVTGCCHRGLANTLRAAKFLAHDEPIVAIVGGLHLGDADEDELTQVLALLERYGNPKLYTCHCTGDKAATYLAEKLGEQVCPIQAGWQGAF